MKVYTWSKMLMNASGQKRFVIVAGYGWSGSSVVIDYLKEFECTFVPDIEFRLIKDPYGIYELEHALVNNWDYINSNTAILDFLWLCKKCAQSGTGLLSAMGLDYKTKLNPLFLELSEEFISSLCSFKYHSNSLISKFKKPYFKYLYDRYLDKIYRITHGKIGKYDQGVISYFARIDENTFVESVQEYLESVFQPYFYDDKIVILDQAISPLHTTCLKYFKNAKMIVVDRNPSDIYVDLIRSKGLIGGELAESRDPSLYVEWHNAIRNDKVISENILYLKFEDMVLDYEITSRKIREFLNWDLGKHINQRKYFDPNVSKQNVGFGVCKDCSAEEYNYIVNNINILK